MGRIGFGIAKNQSVFVVIEKFLSMVEVIAVGNQVLGSVTIFFQTLEDAGFRPEIRDSAFS